MNEYVLHCHNNNTFYVQRKNGTGPKVSVEYLSKKENQDKWIKLELESVFSMYYWLEKFHPEFLI